MKKFLTYLISAICVLTVGLTLGGCNKTPAKVTFYLGDEVYLTETADELGSIDYPQDPTVQSGKRFDGWYYDEGTWQKPFTKLSAALDTFQKDTSIYAKLSDVYSVAFHVAGEVYVTLEADKDGRITLPEAPTVAQGFEFGGWYYDDGTFTQPFTQASLATSPITQNTDVYAKISRAYYTIEFMVGSSLYQTVTTDDNGVLTLPQDPTVAEGYVFDGWYYDNGVWELPFNADEIMKSTKVYAKQEYKYVVNASNATIGTLEIGSRVWSTNDYVFTSLPKALLGKDYVLWSINGPNTMTSLRSGWLYVITGEAVDFGTASSQMEKLDGYNFTLLDTSFWNLWSAALKNNFVYEKYVEKGETFEVYFSS